MVDRRGRFFRLEDLDAAYVQTNINRKLYAEYAGRFVKNSYDDSLTENDATLDIDLSVQLKKEGKAFRVEKYEHSYPHCWRTDKPVLYYPLDSWFIRSTAVRDEMIDLNKTINWKPQSTGDRPVWQLAGELSRLEPLPLQVLGNPAAYLAYRRRIGRVVHRFR